MPTILIILLILLLVGGGFGFHRYGPVGGGISVGTLLIIILILWAIGAI